MTGSSTAAGASTVSLPPRQVLRHGGGRLSYREAGSGPAIVFLHGLLGSSDSWVCQFRGLAGGYRVIAWDAPGYGDSDIVAPSAAAFADALEVLLGRLGVADVCLVGHSMGGVVAAVAAARRGGMIGRLVLSCTHAGYADDPASPPSPKLLRRISDLETLGGDAYGRQRARAMVAPGTSSAVIDLAAGIAAQTRPAGLFAATRMLQFADARPCYGKLDLPTLVLFGAEDPVVRPELSAELRGLTPFARPVDLPGVGHAPYLEDPETYTQTIRTFIEGGS